MKQFKENSHQTIQSIRQQQARHKRDLVQPRESGEVNPAYVQSFGAKNLNVSRHDVEVMAKKSQSMAKVLDNKRRNDETASVSKL